MRIGKFVACVLLILLIPSSIGLWFPLRHDILAYATIRVPQDYVTIQAAVDHSGSGDTILVSSGVYYEHVTLSHASSLLAIVGENPATTIIDGGGTGAVVSIGMTAHLSNSILTGLTIRNGDTGIEMGYMSQCPGIHNCILNNNKVGIYIETYVELSSGIYHNSFINNTQQVWASMLYLPISWDNGYPSGGNYWSDYVARYPNATETDGSGIWNTPYVIDSNNRDNYPLMMPWTEVHDIAVSSVTVSKTVIGQGYSASVNVTLENQGNFTETFNVTAYANTTAIATFTDVTLTSGNLTILTFTWNTTGFAFGNYSISAFASPVEGETYLTDNTLVDGWVYVSIPGDINGDQYVNAKDAVILGVAFGATRGDPTYSPNADISNDDFVNAKDAVILGTYFGQHWS